jgi:hypothetical protein
MAARDTKISAYPKGQVDVLLHEGLIGDAITTLDPYASHFTPRGWGF